jgi:hypothetical protein
MDMSRTMKMCVLAVCGVIMLAGCSSRGGLRFYPDEPRSQKEVTLVFTHRHLHLDSITREGNEKMNLVGSGGEMSELIPGKYVLELRYSNQGTYRNVYGGTVLFSLQTVAGHVYYIYPEFSAQNTWSPAVVDIASEADYLKINGNADVNPEDIKKWVMNYYSGPRTSAQKEVHPTSNGVITIWR